MTEPAIVYDAVDGAARAAAPRLADLGEALQALKAHGLDRYDPARFHYLQVLAARVPAQPVAVQRVLLQMLSTAATDYGVRARAAHATASFSAPVERGTAAPLRDCALAQLNRALRTRSAEDSDGVYNSSGSAHGDSVYELRSVRQFGQVWTQICAERQVTHALARGPQNAGPLNSHRLVLRSLEMMRTLSPHYLQHFLSQMDTLLALEQMNAKPLRAPARSTRRTRPKP